MVCCDKLYQCCLDRDPWWRYNVRRKCKVALPLSANILMLLLIIAGLVTLIDLIDTHMTQTVKLSALKTLEI
jgi:hypothetical protein